jgi:hypothetical protein
MPPNASAPASHSGLSGMEAAERLKAEGFNELPSQGRRTPLRIALEMLKEPMLGRLRHGPTIARGSGASELGSTCLSITSRHRYEARGRSFTRLSPELASRVPPATELR